MDLPKFCLDCIRLIVFKYDCRVSEDLLRFLMRCSGNTWEEVGQKVSLLGQWEFEGYRPNSH
jgi:hypothetical protein